MNVEQDVLASENRFFTALSAADGAALESIVGRDCVLIDVMTGSEVAGSDFVDLVASRKLGFERVERLEARVRLLEGTAIVTGRTHMRGMYEGQVFSVHSRYTHVYARARGVWRLVHAQGTPVVTAAR